MICTNTIKPSNQIEKVGTDVNYSLSLNAYFSQFPTIHFSVSAKDQMLLATSAKLNVDLIFSVHTITITFNFTGKCDKVYFGIPISKASLVVSSVLTVAGRTMVSLLKPPAIPKNRQN